MRQKLQHAKAIRARLGLILIMTTALSGCHLAGKWTIVEISGTHELEHRKSGEPEHFERGDWFELSRCPVRGKRGYCVVKVGTDSCFPGAGLYPEAEWKQLQLFHPNKAQKTALRNFELTQDLCKKRCVIGDFKAHSDKLHIIVIDQLRDLDDSNPCQQGKKCAEINVFCLDEGCTLGVDALTGPVINLAGIRPIHKGSGHSHSGGS